jgi:type IV pilus assembly protein PilN
MIKINLLPFRKARRRENVRRQVNVYFLCLLFLFSLMLYFHFDLSGQLAQLETRKESLQNELKTYEAITKEIAQLKSETQTLKTKLEVIRSLDKQRVGPVQLLSEVATAAPLDRLWLEKLSESKGVLTLRGTAMDNHTVALFMTELEKAPQIQSVDLDKTTLKFFPKHKLRAAGFVLTCRTVFEAPKPEKKQDRKKKKR